jgi:hypothetical protein
MMLIFSEQNESDAYIERQSQRRHVNKLKRQEYLKSHQNEQFNDLILATLTPRQDMQLAHNLENRSPRKVQNLVPALPKVSPNYGINIVQNGLQRQQKLREQSAGGKMAPQYAIAKRPKSLTRRSSKVEPIQEQNVANLANLAPPVNITKHDSSATIETGVTELSNMSINKLNEAFVRPASATSSTFDSPGHDDDIDLISSI